MFLNNHQYIFRMLIYIFKGHNYRNYFFQFSKNIIAHILIILHIYILHRLNYFQC